ncbi:class F sortase [Streptomyces inusitatus]|uniref:class F sortase n=1 Tax=Streptomyces inusitatus TaxID=68221 RepID=UPI0035713D74
MLSVLLFGVFLLRAGTAGSAAGPPPAPRAEAAVPHRAAATAAATATAAGRPAVPDPLPRSRPLRIAIPSLRVDAPLVGVGLGADRRIAAPPAADGGSAGWYAGAAAPGERGTAVVVGHVDNAAGPAVFYPLGSLERGGRIEVLREDGRTAVFTVYGNEAHPLASFPAERVYRDGPRPELRLITCGGRYTERTGYDGNVVVFARLTEVR